MRKTSINLYCNTELDSKYKIDKIKQLGFNEFFTGVYADKETMTAKEQIDYAKSIGLECTMLHCSYHEPDLNDFWLDTPIGESVYTNYANQIKEHKGYCDNFVVHLNGSFESKTTKIGLSRIRKLLDICEECDTNLCIENLYSIEEIPYIFANIKHPKLKICFDIGHRNFLTPKFDVMKEYGEHITVLHLHDNHGKTDEHLVCGEGNIDWEEFAQAITQFPNLVLAAEVKSTFHDKNTIIEDQLVAFNTLKNMINKYE